MPSSLIFLKSIHYFFPQRHEENNVKPQSLGIVFHDLRMSGLTAASSYFPILGSLFKPVSIIENVQNFRHSNVMDNLSGFEGVVKPGEMIRMFIHLISCGLHR